IARNAEDTLFSHIGFRVDFELSNLDFPGQSVPVVIPLPEGAAIPAAAVWRKYMANGWVTFVEDEANRIDSAAVAADGRCPWPGSDSWTAGLNPGDACVRLTIQDGGPNDLDGNADGVIRDPGALAVAESAEAVSTGSSVLKS